MISYGRSTNEFLSGIKNAKLLSLAYFNTKNCPTKKQGLMKTSQS